jgi:hypothetical protein
MPRKSDAPLRVAIYSRVSTDHQTTENQERELQAIAERIGWTVVKVYRDQGVSGAKSRQDRPAFDALCKDAAVPPKLSLCQAVSRPPPSRTAHRRRSRERRGTRAILRATRAAWRPYSPALHR